MNFAVERKYCFHNTFPPNRSTNNCKKIIVEVAYIEIGGGKDYSNSTDWSHVFPTQCVKQLQEKVVPFTIHLPLFLHIISKGCPITVTYI